MQVLHETHNYRLCWYNPEKTVIWLHGFAPWSWDDAYNIIMMANKHIVTVPHGVYTVFYLEGDGNQIQRENALQGIRQLVLTQDPPNEIQTIIITTNKTLKSFVDAVHRMNPILGTVDTYLYYETKEEALKYLTKIGVLENAYTMPHKIELTDT
jgi:hypothetical protein